MSKSDLTESVQAFTERVAENVVRAVTTHFDPSCENHCQRNVRVAARIIAAALEERERARIAACVIDADRARRNEEV